MGSPQLARRHHASKPLQHLTDGELETMRVVFGSMFASGMLRRDLRDQLGELLELITYETGDRALRAELAHLDRKAHP